MLRLAKCIFHFNLCKKLACSATCAPARNLSAGYTAWGHSTLVGPFGEVLATTEHEEATIISEVDYSVIELQRINLPLEKQRRGDIYQLVDEQRSHRIDLLFWPVFVISTLAAIVGSQARGNLEPPCNAVGFIDWIILGEKHLYQRPVYRRTKECSVNSPDYGPLPSNAPGWCLAPFDPEGI